MARTPVTRADGKTTWFDPDVATIVFTEGVVWDGTNKVGLVSQSPWFREDLLRTAGGRLVIRSRCIRADAPRPDRCRYVTSSEAHDWAVRAGLSVDQKEPE